jgi:hypothetical protein
MDKRLYQSGHIAIPLSANIGHTLSPQPNFLIVEDIRGKNKVELPVLGDTICKIALYFEYSLNLSLISFVISQILHLFSIAFVMSDDISF